MRKPQKRRNKKTVSFEYLLVSLKSGPECCETCSRSAMPPTVLVKISICTFTESYEMDQEESSLQSYATSEESLSPIIRMERFMLSDIIVNR